MLRADPSVRVASRAHKMSKSRGNVVNPDDVVTMYGADSLRLYEMFMGPIRDTKVCFSTLRPAQACMHRSGCRPKLSRSVVAHGVLGVEHEVCGGRAQVPGARLQARHSRQVDRGRAVTGTAAPAACHHQAGEGGSLLLQLRVPACPARIMMVLLHRR